eukprot:TRINITY_DN5364_c0_g1_i2.p1 TRINITY_DN5364_c0_g1~~TRINITY_DN5364_c0_g1_i2.p1  ORF type:complete len:423 (+),score=65.04 TRINITY_DN5364_c0_g1_i2:667-1935(+)
MGSCVNDFLLKTGINVCVESTQHGCDKLENVTVTTYSNPKFTWTWTDGGLCATRGACCDGEKVCVMASSEGCQIFKQVVSNNITHDPYSNCYDCIGVLYAVSGSIFCNNASDLSELGDKCGDERIVIEQGNTTVLNTTSNDILRVASNETALIESLMNYRDAFIFGDLRTADGGHLNLKGDLSLVDGSLSMEGGKITSLNFKSDEGNLTVDSGSIVQANYVAIRRDSRMTVVNGSILTKKFDVLDSSAEIISSTIQADSANLSGGVLTLAGSQLNIQTSITISSGMNLTYHLDSKALDGLTAGSNQTIVVISSGQLSGAFDQVNIVNENPPKNPCDQVDHDVKYSNNALMVIFSTRNTCVNSGDLNSVENTTTQAWVTPVTAVLVVFGVLIVIGGFGFAKYRVYIRERTITRTLKSKVGESV